MKGKIKIELTNTQTGIKKVVNKENMMTNAIAKAMSFRCGSFVPRLDTFMPLCEKGLGGLLLFPEPLDENVNNIFAPIENEPTGYASNNVNTTTDTRRGSINELESREIQGGYKFVWEFNPSQANGEISALALTHANAGVCYFSSSHYSGYGYSTLGSQQINFSSTNYQQNIVDIDIINSLYHSIFYDNSKGKVVIAKIYLPAYKIAGINTTDKGSLIDSYELDTQLFNRSGARYFDGKDGYWYGFLHTSNSDGNATVHYIKINKMDYTFTEDTWILNGVQLYNFQGVLLHKKLYALNSARTGLYEIDITNPSDVTLHHLSETPVTSRIYNYAGYIVSSSFRFNPVTKEVILTSDHQTPHGTTSYIFNFDNQELFIYDNILIGIRSYYIYFYLINSYLGTISNLDSPVVKTPADTMTVEYTITDG